MDRTTPAEPPPDEPAVADSAPATVAPLAGVVLPPSSGAQPLALFAGILALLIVTFGGAALVLVGLGRVSSEPEPTATLTSAPFRTAAPASGDAAATGAAAAAAGRVRIVSASARSRPIANGAQHEVTFTWTLDGAREGDPVVLQFYAGTRALGQQRGALDPQVFNFSTGVLTLLATMDCSTGGWTAEILTIRGQPIEGDSDASAAGVQCPR